METIGLMSWLASPVLYERTTVNLWASFASFSNVLPNVIPGSEVGISPVELRLPAGPAVEVVDKVHGDDVTVVFLPHAGRSYELVLRGAGSVKARSDFDRVLRSLQVS